MAAAVRVRIPPPPPLKPLITADQLDRVTLALADLDAAGKPSELDLPGYRLHPLRGDRRGSWSISITGNWRITFRFEDGDVYDVDLVDYH